MQKTEIRECLAASLCILLSMALSIKGSFLLSGLLLILCGAVLCGRNMIRSGSLLSPAALFSLSFLSALGVSCLKLSRLETVWEGKTWISFLLIYVSFTVSYRFLSRKISEKKLPEIPPAGEISLSRVIFFLTAVSYGCFLLEALLLGYVPLFTVDTPHAYSYFHISGVHYFTVLCSLVPPAVVLYLHEVRGKKISLRTKAVIAAAVLSLFLPILLVSRYQLLFACILSAVTFLTVNAGELRKYLRKGFVIPVLGSLLCLVLLYVFITVERAHSVEYLNGIFEMKNPDTPIWFTQPYIYIANNFDNFNCLVKDLPRHTFGLRMLFPVFALTGLKFRYPQLVSFPLYVTKEELTTVTMFYDAFYDFGIPGVVVFSVLLGALMACCEKLAEKGKRSFTAVICAQLTAYLILAFFTTWYSNPTTWFYLIISIAIEIILCYSTIKSPEKKGWKQND